MKKKKKTSLRHLIESGVCHLLLSSYIFLEYFIIELSLFMTVLSLMCVCVTLLLMKDRYCLVILLFSSSELIPLVNNEAHKFTLKKQKNIRETKEL